MAKKGKNKDYGCYPSRFWYTLFGSGVVISIARLVFNIKVKRDPKVMKMEGPLVVVGNHPSYLDPIILACTLYWRPINFVAGTFLFRNRIFGAVIKSGGCIPKAQFRTDTRAVRAMLNVLSRGGVLGIFPEATRFVDGNSIFFDDALARLIKKTNSGIAFLESHGSYMTWPRWSKSGSRRGKIEGHLRCVYTKEEVKAMSVEELYELMKKELTYNEYDWFREHPQEFKSKAIAAGAENIAHACPRCGKMNVMQSDKDILFCRECGNRVRMEKTGFLVPVTDEDKAFSDLHQWVMWEKDLIAKAITTPEYTYRDHVFLHHPIGEYNYALVGEGTLFLDGDTLIYEGTECPVEDGIIFKKGKPLRKHAKRDITQTAENVHKEFIIHKMCGFSVDYGKRIEIFDANGTVNRFLPEHAQRLYELQCVMEHIKNTPQGESSPRTE